MKYGETKLKLARKKPTQCPECQPACTQTCITFGQVQTDPEVKHLGARAGEDSFLASHLGSWSDNGSQNTEVSPEMCLGGPCRVQFLPDLRHYQVGISQMLIIIHKFISKYSVPPTHSTDPQLRTRLRSNRYPQSPKVSLGLTFCSSR